MKLTRLVPTEKGFRPLTIRNYTRADIPQLIDIQRECFPPPFPPELWWFDPQQLEDWATATDNGYIRKAYRPQGNALYVVDISVRPAWRKAGVGRALMEAMYATVVHLGVERLVGGARLPGYCHYQHLFSVSQYLERVLAGKIADPVITFLLKRGRTPQALVPNYLEDEESANHGLLMEWRNPFLAD